MNKWRKRGIIFLSSVILLWLSIISINYGLYKNSIPESYGDNYWEGFWNSDQTSLITGRIAADLPDELPLNTYFNFNAIVYYNIWGVYKNGTSTEIELTGFFSHDDVNGSGNSSDSLNHEPYKIAFVTKFDSNNDLRVNYSAEGNEDLTEIIGSYEALAPYDTGAFSIEKD